MGLWERREWVDRLPFKSITEVLNLKDALAHPKEVKLTNSLVIVRNV